MRNKMLLIVSICLLLVVVMSACNNSEKQGSNSNDNTNSNDTEKISGSVAVDGSGTVYPLMAKLAEEYMTTKNENVSIEVSRSGTSAGFKKFLVEKGTDFNNASRMIKDEEVVSAEQLNLELKEMKVALDGLTFVIHPDNSWAQELTKDDLLRIFKADDNVTKWSDLNPSFPNEVINTYGPNENHGTYEFFWENILGKTDLVDSINLQQEYSTLVKLISEDVNGIAFFGFGYYVNNTDKLKAVHVDFGKGYVEPSLETIAEDGDYAPFTRPVFTYLNINNAKERSQVLDYAQFVVENMNKFAGETGFAPLPDAEIESYKQFLQTIK